MSQNSQGGGYGQMPQYGGGMNGRNGYNGGFNGGGMGGPTRVGSGYQKPMVMPQQTTNGMQAQQQPGYGGDPNDSYAAMQWLQQNQNKVPQQTYADNGMQQMRMNGSQGGFPGFGGQSPWNSYNPQAADSNPNISGQQAYPWYAQPGMQNPVSTVTPGRYNGFVSGDMYDDQGNARMQGPKNPWGTDFNYWMGVKR